jgi:tetratricopeptide (TPR) repeat protein
MHLIDLKTASAEIHQAVDQRFAHKEAPPFFFIVGAGISYPPIPLAKTIEERCRIESSKYKKAMPPPIGSALSTYSYWFEQAFPSAEGRQRFLRDMMEDAFISKANFRLAHLMLDKTIARIVVTPNFDDFLARALTLFGHRPIVCDHPQTLERINVESKDIQIIHVHGSYWFYDCCNLTDEVDSRAHYSATPTFSTRSSLNEILRLRSPIVVGYSGWEDDVIMSAIKARLAYKLGTNIYWFCYKRSDFELLPKWLKVPGVKFVVPDDTNLLTQQISDGATNINDLISEGEAGKTEGMGDSETATLSAIDIFESLIREFQLKSPSLTEDPLGFFVQQLRSSLMIDSVVDQDKDIYAIRSVIERLEKLRDAEQGLEKTEIELNLERFRNAVRQSDYLTAVAIAKNLDLEELDPESLREILIALTRVGTAMDDNSEIELLAYNLALQACAVLESIDKTTPQDQANAAKALLNRAITLGSQDKVDETIAAYDQLTSKFQLSVDPHLLKVVASGFFNKGKFLEALERYEEAIEALDSLIALHEEHSPDVLEEQASRAYLRKAAIAGQLKKTQDDDIRLYNELLGRFENSVDLGVNAVMAKAMFNRSFRFGNLKRNEEQLDSYNELIERYGNSHEPEIEIQVLKALLNRSINFGITNQYDKSIEGLDEIIRRAIDSSNPEFSSRYSRALLIKGNHLGRIGDHVASIAAYDAFLTRFDGSSELALKEQTSRVLAGKATQLMALKRTEEALVICDEITRQLVS